MAYQNSQYSFHSSTDHCQCFWQKWIPQEGVKRTLVFQHGLGEHSGRYQHLINCFSGTGTAFYAMDARGHGHSEGKKGHVKSLKLYADDLHDFVPLVLREQNVNEVFLLGHSLGGMIAILYAIEHQQHLRGLILSAPGIALYMSAYMKIAKMAARGLTSFAPSFTLGATMNRKYLSHDPQAIADYKADPLVYERASALLGHEMFEAHKNLYKKAPLLNIPLYIMHGTGDQITDPKGSEKFYELAGSADKTLRLYQGLYHEIINESAADREVVLKELKKWVLAR